MNISILKNIILRYGYCLGIGFAIAASSLSKAHEVNPKEATLASNEKFVAPNSGGVTTVRSHSPIITRQQVQIYPGISTASAGSQQLSMNRIILPPGMKGLRHMHKDTETVIYIIEGNARTLIGEKGEVVVDNKAGDFIFIPANVWHQPTNVSNDRVVAIEVRADADDQQNVILSPHQ
jgi:uncharacterized RmlC-like cupin family protein